MLTAHIALTGTCTCSVYAAGSCAYQNSQSVCQSVYSQAFWNAAALCLCDFQNWECSPFPSSVSSYALHVFPLFRSLPSSASTLPAPFLHLFWVFNKRQQRKGYFPPVRQRRHLQFGVRGAIVYTSKHQCDKRIVGNVSLVGLRTDGGLVLLVREKALSFVACLWSHTLCWTYIDWCSYCSSLPSLINLI